MAKSKNEEVVKDESKPVKVGKVPTPDGCPRALKDNEVYLGNGTIKTEATKTADEVEAVQ